MQSATNVAITSQDKKKQACFSLTTTFCIFYKDPLYEEKANVVSKTCLLPANPLIIEDVLVMDIITLSSGGCGLFSFNLNVLPYLKCF